MIDEVDQPLITVRRGWVEDRGTVVAATCERCGWSRELDAFASGWPLHAANYWAVQITEHLSACPAVAA